VSRGGIPVLDVDRGDKDAHYSELARRLSELVPMEEHCCWGDARLLALASGRAHASTQEAMRAIGTCHHISRLARERQSRAVSQRITTPTAVNADPVPSL